MGNFLIQNATIINEGKRFVGNVLIENQLIKKISVSTIEIPPETNVINAEGLILVPGMIDDQVHFREPGLTHKANIHSESRAAVAGGITSFMEMPNTVPNTLTQELLQDKYDIAEESSMANYSFFFGASNDNLKEVLKTNPKNVCGIKVFMGSSTGNMLVDNPITLEGLFKECKMLIASHCEDEETVKRNFSRFQSQYGDEIPMKFHPQIRSEEACYISSSKAIELASKHDARLHILHISTAKETQLFDIAPLSEKRITAEACVHHLWFNDSDYHTKGSNIKWNPAVKSEKDRLAIIDAVKSGRIDVLATDHAPHTIEEKSQIYIKAPSGGPLVQHAVVSLFEMANQGLFTLEEIVQKNAHNVAELFEINNRGYIREGYFADLVLIDPRETWEVNTTNILYKCGWSPFEGQRFQNKVKVTFINGHKVYDNGIFDESFRGARLTFDR